MAVVSRYHEGMAKFFVGLVSGVVLVLLTFVLLFVALVRFRERPPTVANNSVLILRLAGNLPEKPPVELPDFLGGRSGVTVASIWMSLKKAAVDPRIKAVVLEPEGITAGWATLEEIRSDVEQFSKSGKPVYANLRVPTARDYYVALAADRIYLGPEDPLMLKGLRAEVTYFKQTLDKLGVNVQVEHAGKYKDFGDMFTRTDMSPQTREVMNSLVDGIYGNLVARIADSRKKAASEVMAIIDQGPFTARQALKAGLVDDLRYPDEAWGALKDRLKSGEPTKISLSTYMRVPAESAGLRGKSRVALIVGQGDIVRGSPNDDGSEEGTLTAYGFNKILRQVGNDAGIKAVIVRIDSPGGEVTASDDIWREMNVLSKKKPLVISMADVAASGGYYMAMTGDPIVAYPQTQTGSIGVVFGKPYLRGLYDKLGITKDAIERGRNAAIDSDYTALTPEQRRKLREGIDESYESFVSKVAKARKRSFAEIEPVAQGRVWLGTQAKARGLLDELGGFDRAIELVKLKAKIPADEQVRIFTYPARRSLIEVLLQRNQEDLLQSRIAQVLGRVPFRAWMKGGFLRMMPYWLEVH